MAKVTVSTSLACSADAAFEALQSIQTFVHVARGALRFPAAESYDSPVSIGASVSGWIFLLGVVPMSRHTITVVALDHDERRLATHEHGGLVRRWDHTIQVTPEGDHACRYVDSIEIDAGPVTPFVAAFAHVFFLYRQRRWRRLAPVLDGAARARGTASDEPV